MPNLLRFFFVLVLCCIANSTLAWGFRGHILVAEIAYKSLSQQDKQHVNQYANIIYQHLPNKIKKRFSYSYPNVSTFSLLAPLPDTWRSMTLQDIFNRFDAPLPTVLKPYRYQTTKQWHFINHSYGNFNCNYMNKHNVAWAINLLQQAWKQTNNNNARAVIMVLLEHFIGDIEQPLHTFSHTDKQCNSDIGANRYKVRLGRRKTISLHRLWDDGVGYLNRRIRFPQKAKSIMFEFPRSDFSHQLKESNPEKWASANLRYADFIYSIPKYHYVTRQYYRRGQYIVRWQLALAGYRLAEVLST